MEWTAATGSGMCGEGFGLYSEMKRQRETQEGRVRDWEQEGETVSDLTPFSRCWMG